MKHIKTGDAQDLLDMMPKERAYNPNKKYTRAQAERALSNGLDPEPFTKHANYHVRYKAWRKMGSPLPEGDGAVIEFLVTLQGKQAPKEEEAKTAFYAGLRQKFLKEQPPAPEQELVQLDDRNDPPTATE